MLLDQDRLEPCPGEVVHRIGQEGADLEIIFGLCDLHSLPTPETSSSSGGSTDGSSGSE